LGTAGDPLNRFFQIFQQSHALTFKTADLSTAWLSHWFHVWRGVDAAASGALRLASIQLGQRRMRKNRPASFGFASKLLQLQLSVFTSKQAPRC
jgi:hypothetical protein